MHVQINLQKSIGQSMTKNIKEVQFIQVNGSACYNQIFIQFFSMSNSFNLYNRNYYIEVELSGLHLSQLHLKVYKVIQNKIDHMFAFFKVYTYQNLPQKFRQSYQFNSIKDVYSYLQTVRKEIKIFRTTLIIPFQEDEIYLELQNKSEQSKIFVDALNQQIVELYRKQEQQQQKNYYSNDQEIVYAKIFAFYQQNSHQNHLQTNTMRQITMIEFVDQLILRYQLVEEQRNIAIKKDNNGMKKKKLNQNQEQVQKLNKQIAKLKLMLETSKYNFQTTMALTIKSQLEQMNKIINQEQLKTKNQILLSIQDYVEAIKTTIVRANLNQPKIIFLTQEDIKRYIKSLEDQIQELKYQLIWERHTIRQLQKQMCQMRFSSNNVSKIFVDDEQQEQQNDY